MTDLVQSTEELLTQGVPAKTLLALTARSQMIKRGIAKLAKTVNAHPGMFMVLEDMEIEAGWDVNGGCVDIRFAGDGPKLAQMWKLLRSYGWKPDEHPSGGQQTEFCCFWRKEGYGNLWVHFTSTVCKRVQVGTEMVEKPIYEVQCGDLPALESNSE